MSVPSPVIALSELAGERIELPSGGWILLRHLNDLRSRHRETVADAIPTDDMSAGDVVRMQRKVAEVMIVAWHLPYEPGAPLPSDDPDALRELSVRDENVLNKSLETVMKLINPSTVDPSDHKDPDSPTEPAGDSTPA